MKRIVLCVLILVLSLSLTGCFGVADQGAIHAVLGLFSFYMESGDASSISDLFVPENREEAYTIYSARFQLVNYTSYEFRNTSINIVGDYAEVTTTYYRSFYEIGNPSNSYTDHHTFTLTFRKVGTLQWKIAKDPHFGYIYGG